MDLRDNDLAFFLYCDLARRLEEFGKADNDSC
jgi:hypothetical protein